MNKYGNGSSFEGPWILKKLCFSVYKGNVGGISPTDKSKFGFRKIQKKKLTDLNAVISGISEEAG